MNKYVIFAIIGFNIATSFSQVKKDSLFFSYDENYLEYEDWANHYYPKDTGDDEGAFLLVRDSIYYNLKPQKVLCLKDYIHSTPFYDESKIRKIQYSRLPEAFDGYEVFLIRKEKRKIEYIRVIPSTEMY